MIQSILHTRHSLLGIRSLLPHAIHFLLLLAVDDKSSICRRLLDAEAIFLKQLIQLLQFEEIDSCAIASAVKVILQQPVLLHPYLRKIVTTVVSEQDFTTWFEHGVDILKCACELVWMKCR